MMQGAPLSKPDIPLAAADFVGLAGEGTVSVRVVRSLLEAVEQAGGRVQPLLRAAWVDPAELAVVDGRLARSKVYRLCELAAEATHDPAFGLHWAESLGETAFVPVSHLLAHAASLRQGLLALERFYPLLSDQMSYRVVEQHERVIIHVRTTAGESPRMQQLLAEMTVAGLFRVIRRLSHARPALICFEYAAPPHLAEYMRVFEGAVLFEQPFTGIVLERAIMDAPAPHQDADVLEALEALGERRLLSIARRAPYALRVREFLVREGWRKQADMKLAAQALGLSVRSLRRRLADEGKAYNDVACEAFAIVAKQLLRNRRRCIKEAAHEMGFADASTFHRAFRRWTGTTPRAYREALLENEERGQPRRVAGWSGACTDLDQ
jgi:AraC-like DNA-binding protein